MRPRRALAILGALGAGFAVGGVVNALDYVLPCLYGAASIAASCGLDGFMRRVKDTTEADPVG